MQKLLELIFRNVDDAKRIRQLSLIFLTSLLFHYRNLFAIKKGTRVCIYIYIYIYDLVVKFRLKYEILFETLFLL